MPSRTGGTATSTTRTPTPSPTVYSNYEAGSWAYPPKDYERWGELVTAHAQHCLERYGTEEVKTWLWELWNEPDIFYWRGTPQEFYELYSVTARAVRKAIPDALVGGPSVTGAGVDFLRGFLQHTRDNGDPLDFVSFHTKGSAFTPWRVYGPTGGPAPEKQSPSANKMIFEVQRMLRVMAEFEEYRDLPAIVDECDAGVPAHHTFYDNPNFEFQNTEYYPVFQIKLMKKLLDLNEIEEAKVDHATSWSFYFEGERYFEGTRSFLTAGGIEKPFLNAYRALAQLGERRIEATSDAAQDVGAIDHSTGRSMAEEIDVLASRSESGTVSVLVWRHTDDQYQRDDAQAEVTLDIAGLSAGSYRLSHFRIDECHSNSHTAWKEQGAPQLPSSEQLEAIKARQGLEQFEEPRSVTAKDGKAGLTVTLPLPSVSLLVLEPQA